MLGLVSMSPSFGLDGRPLFGRSASAVSSLIWAILTVSQWYVDSFGKPDTYVPSFTVIVDLDGRETMG